MNKFTLLDGLVAPLDRANVDTDAIIPKQFLKSIKRTGFGPNLFDEWRYLDAGEPGKDNSQRPLNPDFVLNQPRYAGASILLTRRNFGCGSSREHAPQAIQKYGFKAIIAESYAEIFFGNSTTLGMPCVTAAREHIAKIAAAVEKDPAIEVVIDLVKLEARFAGQSVKIAQRELPAPELYHLRPLMTYSLPSRRMLHWMLVASDEATAGSVIRKAERMRPSSSGSSHCCLWASVP